MQFARACAHMHYSKLAACGRKQDTPRKPPPNFPLLQALLRLGITNGSLRDSLYELPMEH
ncbi:hypothetical protein J41TS4_03770 [Paenibacillus apis]|uniref:Uncharacterized protein n=1 Tax=Paenibacillus apis TaxID=1792174 RepID=A0A919XYY2_9BACL|nr:hypothetical protein J41TS4_03770 [Paenibacillus apis]